MKKICSHCGSTNTGNTAPENLDCMRDYFCYNCNKDFEPINHTVLPEDALKALEDYVDVNKKGNSVEVVPDPKVDGTYAVKVSRMEGRSKTPCEFHLLWNRGAYDECDFECWPPISGELQFLL